VSVLVSIRRYANADEGRIAWALLRSAGIEAVLDHHETCSLLGAVGEVVGVELRVPADQAEDSIAALEYVEIGAFTIDVEADKAA
jgi:hypothetical protein